MVNQADFLKTDWARDVQIPQTTMLRSDFARQLNELNAAAYEAQRKVYAAKDALQAYQIRHAQTPMDGRALDWLNQFDALRREVTVLQQEAFDLAIRAVEFYGRFHLQAVD